MFWRNGQKSRGTKNLKSRARLNRKLLRLEPLESRHMLSGNIVQVAIAGINMTLTGDASNNAIQIQQTSYATPGAFLIKGLNGTKVWDGIGSPNDATTQMNVAGINGSIAVNLQQGQDTLNFLAPPDARAGMNDKSIVIGNLAITNDDGTKNIDINSVRVNGNFGVTNVAGANVFNTLKIENDSVVQGATVITNASSGDSNTSIVSSDLQGTLAITNGDGADIVLVQQLTIGTAAGGATTITNGVGGSTTTFTATTGQSTILYGALSINNGAPLGSALLNEVDFVNTLVRESVTITNGDGNTITNVTNSTLGTDVAAASPLTVNNAAGYDQLTIQATSTSAVCAVPWGATINNGVAGQFYGSMATIKNATIGANSVALAGLTINNDSFDNVIDIEKSTVSSLATLNCAAGGNNIITLGDSGTGAVADTTFGALALTCGGGDDNVTMQNATVLVTTNVNLGAGVDKLTLANVKFGGDTTLDGGPGVNDTYVATSVIRPVGYLFNVLDFEN